jgi:site-specific recombinase XerC
MAFTLHGFKYGATKCQAQADVKLGSAEFTTSCVIPPRVGSVSWCSPVLSYLARYSGHTHGLYAYQLRQWFAWCETNGLDPLAGIQRAHVELYVRKLGDRGLMDSSVVTKMHAVRGYFRFAHIDGLILDRPTLRSTRGCRRCTATSHAPKAWTGWS